MRSQRLSIALVVQWLSLGAAAGFVWYWSVLPQLLDHRPLSRLAGRAFSLTVTLWCWSVLSGLLLFLVARVSKPKRAVKRASVAVVWFAPAVILIAQFTPAAVFPAIALAATTARLLFVEWRESRGPASRPQSAKPAMLIAVVGQLAVVAFLTNHNLTGAALTVLTIALLTVYSLETGAAETGNLPGLPQSSAGAILTFLLALMLTFGGSLGVAGHPRGNAAASPTVVRKPSQPFANMSGDFIGVVLLAETQPQTRLVEPRPYFGPGRLAPVDHRPLSILFDGRYDIFRWPFHQAPSSSYVQKGNPIDLGFHSADFRPLQMEARQRLDIPLDVHCCRSIQVEIQNADISPGTIWLELVLMDHFAGVSLGRVPVTSRPKPGAKMADVLEFQMPLSIPIEEATELKIIFSRTMGRMERSFRVAIDRFVLKPR